MSTLIKPTVGRVVLFAPGAAPLFGGVFVTPGDGQPCAALVARVWHDRCVNLAVFDANGVSFSFTSVRLLQEDDVAAEGEMHARWMDYQKGQAAKAEQLEARLLATAPASPQPPVSNAFVAPGCEQFTGTAVGLTFGDALAVLKAGGKVARAGWNGRGMWLLLIPASHWETTRGLELLDGLPWIGMKTIDDKFVPWQPSQTDMLAEDWQALDVEVPAEGALVI
jgi:hypothetical protein